jgi:hypothetical protein
LEVGVGHGFGLGLNCEQARSATVGGGLLWKEGFGGGAESNTRGRVCSPEKRKVAHYPIVEILDKFWGCVIVLEVPANMAPG